MRWRVLKITLWMTATLCMILVGVILIALTSAGQTFVATHVLKKVNPKIVGKLTLGSIHISPPGWIRLADVTLADEAGGQIAHFDALTCRFDGLPLLHNSLHIRELRIDEMTLNLDVDSSGNSNLQRALTPHRPSLTDTTAVKPFSWIIQLDTAIINGGSTYLQLPGLSTFTAEVWDLGLRGMFGHDSLDYGLSWNIPGMLSVNAAGQLVVGDPLTSLSGTFALQVDSHFVASLPSPINTAGGLTLESVYQTNGDSLRFTADIRTSELGHASLTATVLYPPEPIAGRGRIVFDQVTPAALWSDTAYAEMNGIVGIAKSASDNRLDGWMLDMELASCRYGDYVLESAQLIIRTQDSTITAQGNFETGHGRLDLSGDLHGLDPKTAAIKADVEFSRLDLHHFIPAVPDTLEPLSGRLSARTSGLEPGTMQADLHFNLDVVRLGRYEFAAVEAVARMEQDSVFLDTVNIAAAGGQIGVRINARLRDALEYRLRAELPDLASLKPFIAETLTPADTLCGALSMVVSGAASLRGDSLSHITARGDMRISDAQFADYRVQLAHLRIIECRVDSLFIKGAIAAKGIQAAGQPVDSIKIVFEGTPDRADINPQLWARADTIRLATRLNYSRQNGDIEIAVNDLNAEAYGIAWQAEGTTTLLLSDGRVELDWLKLRSPVGVLSASGAFHKDGEQDLMLELSGINTGELARIFKLKIPSSSTNIRVQIAGPDTALIGDVSITADSLMLNGLLLADQLQLNATADRRGTVGNGFVIWFGDTLTTFSGELPARISLDEGAILMDSLPMQGQVRLLEQPLDRLNSLLPFGMSLGGMVAGDIRFTGTPAKPDWSGVFSVRDGEYRDSRIGINYGKLNITGDLDRDTLRIRRLNAESEGTLEGSGWAVMAFPLPSELHLEMRLDNFEAVNGPLMKVRAEGNIAVNGPLNKLDARGRIRLNEVLYRITQAATKSIEEIDLEAELAKLRGDTAQPAVLISELYRSMSHELELELPGNCWLRGGGMNIELTGNLWLYKLRNVDPAINGEIRVREGRVQFLGKEFLVDKDNSVVRYEGPIDNPAVDLQADYKQLEAKGILIHVHIYGTLAQTQVDLTGTENGQQMSLDNILVALLTGSSRSGVASGSAAAQIEEAVASGATSQLSGLVGRWAGLDVFEYRAGEGGLSNLSGGSLEVGTYVTDRIFIRVKQPIEVTQTGQEVTIEYRLLDWLKLIAQQNGTISSSLNLLMQVDWR